MIFPFQWISLGIAHVSVVLVLQFNTCKMKIEYLGGTVVEFTVIDLY